MAKRAFMLVDHDVAAASINVLKDAGLRVLKLWHEPMFEETRLPLLLHDEEGSILPAGCESGLPLITATFSTDTYGSQSLTRLVEVRLTGKSIADFMLLQFDIHS